jgi:3-deoxy-D-manno-octulosonic-acid transferase
VCLQLKQKCINDHAALMIMHEQALQQLLELQQEQQAKERHAIEQLSAQVAETQGEATCTMLAVFGV